MIVEDNHEMRKTIRRVVAAPRDVVMECCDGVEAISAYEMFHPDWVLMDYEMPGMDGITATAGIIAADPNAKVLVVSQHNDSDICQAAERAGAKEFIPKVDIVKIKYIITNNKRGKQ